MHKIIACIVAVFALAVFAVFSVVYAPNDVIIVDRADVSGLTPVATTTPLTPTSTVLFVGDVMLGRGVELYMDMYGTMYPFLYVEDILGQPDLTIGNFEGIVSEPHVHAPSMTFQFSIKSEYVQLLADLGFDILSLANNHSSDYGLAALRTTRAVCDRAMIVCGGDPITMHASSSHITRVHNTDIGFLFLHKTWNQFNEEEALAELSKLAEKTDMQVVYIHWGDEYMLQHSQSQEALAHALVDAGVDLIVGHHPHVVQDVELYNDVPIFYSLGNFVFDQNFSVDVQEELGVLMEITDDTISYTLIPFTTQTSKMQPQRMSESRSHVLLSRVLAPISTDPRVDVSAGIIRITR